MSNFYLDVQNSLLYSISPWSLAVKRVPALLLTMALELMGGVVIDQLHKVREVTDCGLMNKKASSS